MTAGPLMVAIGDPRASVDALEAVAPFAVHRKVPVIAVHVIEVERALPLDADLDGESTRGEQLLRRAEHQARDLGFGIEGVLLQARDAGQALVDEARRRHAAALVLGIGYRRLIGQFDLGKTADYVLRHADCQVWLVRQERGAE